MKKIFLSLLAITASTLMGSAAITALHIHTTSHGIVTLLLENEPSLTFNDDRSITVEVPSNPEYEPVKISFDDVESCEYGDENDYVENSVTNVTDDTESSIKMLLIPDGIIFSDIPHGNVVEVYSISGTRITNGVASNGCYTLQRSDLQRGIYIIRIGNFVTKVSF